MYMYVCTCMYVFMYVCVYVCVCVRGRVWIFCGIFFKHDFLIKIMTIDIFVNQAIYDTYGCSLQATMIHR